MSNQLRLIAMLGILQGTVALLGIDIAVAGIIGIFIGLLIISFLIKE